MSSTPISQILDRFMEEGIKLSPIGATMLGVPGLDDQLDDLSMEGNEKRANLPAQLWLRSKALSR